MIFTKSIDGRHLLSICDSKTLEIYGQERDGPWQAKGTISHDVRIKSVTLFSACDCYVVTASLDGKAKITELQMDDYFSTLSPSSLLPSYPA